MSLIFCRHRCFSCKKGVKNSSAYCHSKLGSVCYKLTFIMQVDWSRFYLQLLFVDEDDTSTARTAQCLLDKIAE